MFQSQRDAQACNQEYNYPTNNVVVGSVHWVVLAVTGHFSFEPGLPASQSSLSAMSFKAFCFLRSLARSDGEERCFKRLLMSLARFL